MCVCVCVCCFNSQQRGYIYPSPWHNLSAVFSLYVRDTCARLPNEVDWAYKMLLVLSYEGMDISKVRCTRTHTHAHTHTHTFKCMSVCASLYSPSHTRSITNLCVCVRVGLCGPVQSYSLLDEIHLDRAITHFVTSDEFAVLLGE